MQASFLHFSLAEFNLYSGPQFHQVAETQSQSALTDSPPGLCLQKARWGAIWPSVSSSLPARTHRDVLLSVWSVVSGPCRWPLQPRRPHCKDTLGLQALCAFLTGGILLLLYCSRLQRTLRAALSLRASSDLAFREPKFIWNFCDSLPAPGLILSASVKQALFLNDVTNI